MYDRGIPYASLLLSHTWLVSGRIMPYNIVVQTNDLVLYRYIYKNVKSLHFFLGVLHSSNSSSCCMIRIAAPLEAPTVCTLPVPLPPPRGSHENTGTRYTLRIYGVHAVAAVLLVGVGVGIVQPRPKHEHTNSVAAASCVAEFACRLCSSTRYTSAQAAQSKTSSHHRQQRSSGRGSFVLYVWVLNACKQHTGWYLYRTLACCVVPGTLWLQPRSIFST